MSSWLCGHSRSILARVVHGLATFNELIDAWMDDGCPNVAPTRTSRHARVKSPNTIANARQLLGTSVRPVIGPLWVDRTSTERLEQFFAGMADNGYATSTIDRTWNYLNQACQHALRHRRLKVTRRRRCCCRQRGRRSYARAPLLRHAIDAWDRLLEQGAPPGAEDDAG